MLGAQGAKLGDEGRAGLGGRFPGGLGHSGLLGDHGISIGGFLDKVKGLFQSLATFSAISAASWAARGAHPSRAARGAHPWRAVSPPRRHAQRADPCGGA